MRLRLTIFLLAVLCAAGLLTPAVAQKVASIPEVQFAPLDSLLKLDTLQNATTALRLDKSAYWHGTAFNDDSKNDTLTVTGVVIVAPNVLTYTLARYNVFIQDSAGRVFGGLNVLTDDTSANAQATGINAIDTGMVVTITGKLKEYGSQNNSLTELLAYSVGFYQTIVPISIVGLWGGTGVRPQPVEITCDSLANGLKPKPSSGEKYEGMYVMIRNVTVNSVDVSSGRFTFKDALGNQVGMYDGSRWYTLRGHRASNSKYSYPPVGTTLKYIRGVVLPQPRTGTCGDYNIMPIYPGPKELTGSAYPGDVVVDKYGPTIATIRRNPTPPKSTDQVNVTYKAYSPSVPTRKADSTFFNYRVGTQANRYGSGWVRTRIDSVAGDTVYRATIPAQATNALVSYYVEAYLDGIYSAVPDSSIPSFYVIKDAGYSIYDICFTPYANGLSGFAYDTVSVGGVVISDTSDIKDITTRGGRPNTPLLWLQSRSSANWAGIQIWSPIAGLVDTLQRGDSVIVRGSVYGTSVRTQIAVTSLQYFQRGGVTVPAPTVRLMTSPQYFDYQLGNPPVAGNTTFQPYMGMLLELQNMYIVYRNADNQTDGGSSNYGEFLISNVKTSSPSTYGLRVNDNGVNHFYCDTNTAYIAAYNSTHPFTSGIKTQLIPFFSKVSYIRGILDYTNSNYKLEPRKDDDFGTITSVFLDPSVMPQTYRLEQNYPNPFNPSTIISYSLPTRSRVKLTIYNALGQLIESLVDMEQGQGSYVVQFNASRLATGIYFYDLRAGDFRSTKKMLLLK